MALILSARIGKLVSALGSKSPPSIPNIKGTLITFLAEAELMETEQSTVQAEAKIAALQTEVEVLNKQLETVAIQHKSQVETLAAQREEERGNLKTALDAANKEIERFCAEDAAQKNKDELPDDAVKILLELAEQTYPQSAARIALILDLRPPIAQHHLDKMQENGLVKSDAVSKDQSGNWSIDRKGRAYLVEEGKFIGHLQIHRQPRAPEEILQYLSSGRKAIEAELGVVAGFPLTDPTKGLLLKAMIGALCHEGLIATAHDRISLTDEGRKYLTQRGLIKDRKEGKQDQPARA